MLFFQLVAYCPYRGICWQSEQLGRLIMPATTFLDVLLVLLIGKKLAIIPSATAANNTKRSSDFIGEFSSFFLFFDVFFKLDARGPTNSKLN